MKAHQNYVFIQVLWYIFVYSVIQTSYFYEQSSRRVSSPVGAYLNPCLPFHLSSSVSLSPLPTPPYLGTCQKLAGGRGGGWEF